MRRAVVLLALVPAGIVAATLDVPFSFVDGEVASAAQVNANFAAIETTVNALAGRVETACGATSATAARSCLVIKESCGGSPRSRSYWIDPDEAGPGAPFEVFCDMDRHGGGWALVGKLGESVPPAAGNTLDVDVSLAELKHRTNPGGTAFPRMNLGRFDAWGSRWTFRAEVDSTANGNHYQYTLWRPATGQTLLPSTAGRNWKGTTNGAKTVVLINSTTSARNNATWLAYPGWDLPDAAMWIFSYRVGTITSGQVVDTNGQTIVSHCSPGNITSTATSGTYTACFGINDGIAHSHGRRAFYWIRDTNEDGPIPP